MREVGKLSARRVASLSKPGRYGDGGSLYLQISRSGTKAWILRYQLAGRVRDMGLGSLHSVSLQQARELAREHRLTLLRGEDPVDARKAKLAALRAEAAKRVSFRQASERYIESHRPGWRNPKHAAQWPASLEAYAYPKLGNLSVSDIGVAHVLSALEPIWTTLPDTANRVRGRIEAVLDWAAARGLRQGDNPARWRGHMQNLLPARSKVRKVRHQPALPFDELPAFMAELRGHVGFSARALEIAILTAARTGEVINARWDEFDLAAKLWVVPAERMKAQKEHRVPLSKSALAILNALPRDVDSPFVFPGRKRGTALSNMALLEVVRELRPGITTHGMRSSFRDWASERTDYPREVCEQALAHTLNDKVEAAYRRGDLFEKRRGLMQSWADFLSKPRGESAKVVGIGRAAR